MPRQRTRYWRVTYVFPEDFAQCLKRFKEAASLSSRELAHLLGTAPLTVKRWDTGVMPSYQNLMALAGAGRPLGTRPSAANGQGLSVSPSESEGRSQTDWGERGSFTASCRDCSQLL